MYYLWCRHCISLKPDWEKLSDEWRGDQIGLVAEVDGTALKERLFVMQIVQGYPTIK